MVTFPVVCYWACIAMSLALCLKVGLTVCTVRDATWITLAALGGWLAADFVGAVYHWNQDNYASGPNGFSDHHRDPTVLGQRTLLMNVRAVAIPVAAGLACTMFLCGGVLATFLLTLLNGILYTEQAHGQSHASATEGSAVVRVLQRVPVLPLLISPAAHGRHHAPPIGATAYGGLNGWSNHITEATRFFRGLEALRERLTGRRPAWRDDTAQAESAGGTPTEAPAWCRPRPEQGRWSDAGTG